MAGGTLHHSVVSGGGGFRASFKRRTDALRSKFRFGRARDLNHGNGGGSGIDSNDPIDGGEKLFGDDDDDDTSKADVTTTLLKRAKPSWSEDDQILSLNPTRSTEGETSMNSFVASSAAVLNSISDESSEQENSIHYRRYNHRHSSTKTRVIHPVICKRDIFLGHIDENEVDFGNGDSLFPPAATKPKMKRSIVNPNQRQSRDPPSSFGRTTGKPDPQAEVNAFPNTDAMGEWDETSVGIPFGSIRASGLFSTDGNKDFGVTEEDSSHFEASTLLSDSKIKAGAARVKRSILNSATPTKVKALPPNTIMASMLFRTLDEEEKSYDQKPRKVRKKSSFVSAKSEKKHHSTNGQTHQHHKLRMISEEQEEQTSKQKTTKNKEVYDDDDESLFDFRESIPTQIRESRSSDGSSVSSVTMYSTAPHDPMVRASSNLFQILRSNNFAQFHTHLTGAVSSQRNMAEEFVSETADGVDPPTGSRSNLFEA